MPTPTAFRSVANRVSSTIAVGGGATLGAAGTTLNVTAGTGANFPAAATATPSTWFFVTIDNEILQCTNRATDALTVVRGQEGTAGASHADGAAVELRITAGVFNAAHGNNAGVHQAINDIENGVTPLPLKRTSVTATPYTVLSTDEYIGVNVAGAVVINLPAANSANFTLNYLIIKDESGNAGVNNITITPNGTDKIDGAATKVINTNYGSFRLFNPTGTASVNTSWVTV